MCKTRLTVIIAVLLAVSFAAMLGEEAIIVIVIERLLILDDWGSGSPPASGAI